MTFHSESDGPFPKDRRDFQYQRNNEGEGEEQLTPSEPRLTIGAVISQYNSLGSKLKNDISLREISDTLMELSEFAEQAIMSESEDWFDGHTIKRNIKEMKNYIREFQKISSEYDSIKQRAGALYDDVGRILERYFKVDEDDTQRFDFQYDTTGDGEDDLVAGNAPKDPVDPAHLKQMAHESDGYDSNERYEKNQDIIQRLIKIARTRLKGHHLAKFDTLSTESQVKAAWKIIR